MIGRSIATAFALVLPFAAAAQDIPPGKGAAPDGVYDCKFVRDFGGTNIAGKLEIKGQTYRGLGEVSVLQFSNYSVGAEQALAFTAAGLNLPPAWKVRTVRFVGADAGGKPLVRIFYHQGSEETTHEIACVRS